MTKKRKIYFYDNGMRNAVLGEFKVVDIREDKGALWENFVFSDMRKNMLIDKNIKPSQYFLRTYAGQEIDMIVDHGDHVEGIEIKYKISKKKVPEVWKKEFASNDKNAFRYVCKENYVEYLR